MGHMYCPEGNNGNFGRLMTKLISFVRAACVLVKSLMRPADHMFDMPVVDHFSIDYEEEDLICIDPTSTW